MRLDIRYRMIFRYPTAVREAHNEIRVRPRDLPTQRLLAHRLTTYPLGRVMSFTDYWGTTVHHVGHVAEHDELELIAEAAVDTRPAEPFDAVSLSALRDERFYLEHIEFLTDSPHVAQTDLVVDAGREIVSGTSDVAEAVQAVVTAVRAALTYETGTTHIGIELDELVDGGTGVCQDFSHLAIGWLRGAGIPARYVSGYLFAADETNLDDDEDHTVEVQTHAWVEAAVPGQGWLAVDPTNDRPVGERHVVIGWGRDYDDVAPVRGIYVGDAVPEVEATVEMRRMEPMAKTLSPPPRRVEARRLAPPPAVDVIAAQQQQQQ